MLATKVLQQGEADRPWLIWLHGLLGNNNEWRVIASRCPEWPSLAIDLPGHGDSVAVVCTSFDDISAQISATLQMHGIERYWLVGYSLGGRIAMYHACHGDTRGLQGVIIEGGTQGWPMSRSASSGWRMMPPGPNVFAVSHSPRCWQTGINSRCSPISVRCTVRR